MGYGKKGLYLGIGADGYPRFSIGLLISIMFNSPPYWAAVEDDGFGAVGAGGAVVDEAAAEVGAGPADNGEVTAEVGFGAVDAADVDGVGVVVQPKARKRIRHMAKTI
jgi:hypothetical protein